MSRGAHHPSHGINPAAAALQRQYDRRLERLGARPTSSSFARVTYRSSYEEVVRDFRARPLASHCSCRSCRA